MLTAHSLSELVSLAEFRQPSIVTIGNFDGVHLGHQAILHEVRTRATARQARAVVVTFEPHPSLVLQNSAPTALITRLPRKLNLLEAAGVDLAVVLPFTEELRTLSAREFAQRVLRDGLHALEIHEGESFRLGHRAEAGIDGLRQIGAALSFEVFAHSPVLRRHGPVSSSRIRALISEGAIGPARALLGRSFSIDSTPARGRGYGTKYAVPTINLALNRSPTSGCCPDLLPANGVYATILEIGTGPAKRLFRGVTNAGNRPTFGVDSYAIETHLFDFSPVDLDETTPLRLTFCLQLREERRFANPGELKLQIGRDIEQAQRFFRRCRPAHDRIEALTRVDMRDDPALY